MARAADQATGVSSSYFARIPSRPLLSVVGSFDRTTCRYSSRPGVGRVGLLGSSSGVVGAFGASRASRGLTSWHDALAHPGRPGASLAGPAAPKRWAMISMGKISSAATDPEELEREADGRLVNADVIELGPGEVDAIGIPHGKEPGPPLPGRALDANHGQSLPSPQDPLPPDVDGGRAGRRLWPAGP